MTDPPQTYEPPKPAPAPLQFVPPVLNAVALILLLLNLCSAALWFVALALVFGLVVIFGSRPGRVGAATGSRGPTAGTS
jgi:hypothetical protein